MCLVGRLDEAGRDAHAVGLAQHASLKQVVRPEHLSDLARPARTAFESAGRGTGNHTDAAAAEAPELQNHLLGESVAEVLLARIPAHVRKRKHGEARPVIGSDRWYRDRRAAKRRD